MNQGPSLAQIIKDAIDDRLSSINTMFPGKVTKVDVAAGKCEVQPCFRRVYGDETTSDMPVITGVAIGFYRANNAYISLPIKVGDFVEVRIAQRSLDIWLAKGGVVDPLDPRKFHLSDAVAYPGLYPFSMPPEAAHPDDLVIVNSQSKVSVKPDGEIVMEGQAIRALAQLVVLSGDGDAVALASKVLQELEAVKSAYDSHQHPFTYSAGPTAGALGTTNPPSAPMPEPQSVASTKVKAE